ncbi:hypothetical protein KHS38_09050 [Mucilaginibacter sp. Bleaf8]|nr:hypothetical protein [Mucilaginibacter sp. Bleaf8]
MISVAGCKKDKISIVDPPVKVPTPDTSTEAGFWTIYNPSNSPLPNEQVNAIAIDKQDTKWIGTANGLAQLKGNKWTLFTPTNSSLPSADIRALAVANDGSVWIGTDKGVAHYNGTDWRIYTTTNSALTNGNIKCIVHDSRHNTTWIATDDGIVKIREGQQEHIEGPDVILSMAVDHDGALWLGTFNDLAFIGLIKKYTGGKWTSYRLDQLGYLSALPYGLVIDYENHPVVALAGTVVKSVIRFNGTQWNELTIPEKARGFKSLLMENTKVWIGGDALCLIGAKDTAPLRIPGTDSPIQCMALDSKNRKWVGTIYGGLAVYGVQLN